MGGEARPDLQPPHGLAGARPCPAGERFHGGAGARGILPWPLAGADARCRHAARSRRARRGAARARFHWRSEAAGDLDPVARADRHPADAWRPRRPAGRHPAGRQILRRRGAAGFGLLGVQPARRLENVMQIEDAFEVPLPPDQAWKVLMDIERIAPCMPGAALTEVVDDRTYKGTVAVKLG